MTQLERRCVECGGWHAGEGPRCSDCAMAWEQVCQAEVPEQRVELDKLLAPLWLGPQSTRVARLSEDELVLVSRSDTAQWVKRRYAPVLRQLVGVDACRVVLAYQWAEESATWEEPPPPAEPEEEPWD